MAKTDKVKISIEITVDVTDRDWKKMFRGAKTLTEVAADMQRQYEENEIGLGDLTFEAVDNEAVVRITPV